VARIDPLPPKQWPQEMRAAMAAIQPPAPRHPYPPRDPSRPKGLNALGMLAHHPALTQAFNTFNGHLLFASTLSPRERELLVLRVAAVRRSDYEWAQHAVLAGDAGLRPAEVEAVGQGPDAPGLAAFDRLLVRAVDELLNGAEISDETWAGLRERLDDQQLMDLVFTVGAYETLAMAFRSFGVEIDDDLKRKDASHFREV